MKKKSLVLAVTALMMAAALVVGGTLAYFTDTESADNVFTTGNVQINLIEKGRDKDGNVTDFSDPATDTLLMPGKNINKNVTVENSGFQDCYVRIHLAIPAALDNGLPDFAAVNNLLHFNFTSASIADGQWSWLPYSSTGIGYKGNGAENWNSYPATVDGVAYNVYVATYRSILPAGTTTTTTALDKVYLDKGVDATVDGNTIYLTDKQGNSVDMSTNNHILVVAEATQTVGFADAYAALNAAFGIPGTAADQDNAFASADAQV